MHDYLWSPWRMEYIKRPKGSEEGCILCAVIDDQEELLVHQTKDLFVVMNLYPYNNGHIMVCPKKHVSDFDEINSDIQVQILSTATKIIKFMKKNMDVEGFNIGANIGKVAGAGIHDHFHMHVVPRWLGDTNFMPVVGNTKVQVSTLHETCNFIKKAFK